MDLQEYLSSNSGALDSSNHDGLLRHLLNNPHIMGLSPELMFYPKVFFRYSPEGFQGEIDIVAQSRDNLFIIEAKTIKSCFSSSRTRMEKVATAQLIGARTFIRTFDIEPAACYLVVGSGRGALQVFEPLKAYDMYKKLEKTRLDM